MSGSPNNRIEKAILIDLHQNVVRRDVVEKRSKWLKAWRKRNIILFSNRLVFLQEGATKPSHSNTISLDKITQVQDCGPLSCYMKIHTCDQTYQLKMQSTIQKNSWIQDIRQASRTYQLNRNSNYKKCRSENLHPTRHLFCGISTCI